MEKGEFQEIFLKALTEGEKRIWEGREFQRRGPATQNEQSPIIARLVHEAQRRCSFPERRFSPGFSLPDTLLMRKTGKRNEIVYTLEGHEPQFEDDSLINW